MIETFYQGKPALILTSADLTLLDTPFSKKARELEYKLKTLRASKIKNLLIITSREYASLPRFLREYVIVEKHCFQISFTFGRNTK